MIYIGRWQKIVVLSILFLGFLFATPNILPPQVRAGLPAWMPSSTVNLGLDLQGGSYLLLEIDMPGVVKERLDTLRSDIRAAIRKSASPIPARTRRRTASASRFPTCRS